MTESRNRPANLELLLLETPVAETSWFGGSEAGAVFAGVVALGGVGRMAEGATVVM
jgi:hypothetical protein